MDYGCGQVLFKDAGTNIMTPSAQAPWICRGALLFFCSSDGSH